jgi:hypothetical protein
VRISRVHLVNSQPLLTNSPVLIAAGTLSGSFVTPPVDVQHLTDWSASAVVQGVKGIGTWQVCNDLSPNEYTPAGLSLWIDYPSLQTPMSASQNTQQQTFWSLQHFGPAYVRFAWIHQAGTGSIDVSFTGKGM